MVGAEGVLAVFLLRERSKKIGKYFFHKILVGSRP
jgi:hypothetical protein